MKLPLLLCIVLCALAAGRFRLCSGGCRCQSGFDVITCPGTNLTDLPKIFDVSVTVRTRVLGLQRNRISDLSTSEIRRRFPRLRLLDLRSQQVDVVRLHGPHLPANLTVQGKYRSIFSRDLISLFSFKKKSYRLTRLTCYNIALAQPPSLFFCWLCR